MGVTWSQPKPIKDATTIMFKADFPKTQKLKAQLWNLWKSYKNGLKQDGFSIKCYNKVWYIYYFIETTEESYEKINQEPIYMIEFKQKFIEWKEILDELNSIEGVQTEPDEEPWYFDMENDTLTEDNE
jgi:hypothetical protein